MATPVRIVLRPSRAAARSAIASPWLRGPSGRLAEAGRDAENTARHRLETSSGDLLRGPAPEVVARSLVEHHVAERVAAELTKAGGIDSAALEEIERDVADRVLTSPAFKRTLAQVVEVVVTSPEVHAALRRSSTTMAEQVAAAVQWRLAELDRAIEETVGRVLRRRSYPIAGYPGIASRAVAFALDTGVVFAIALGAAAMGELAAALVRPVHADWLADVFAGGVFSALVCVYFVVCWSTIGQTPGMRVLDLHIVGPGYRPPGLGRSLVRLAGLVLAIIPLFLGFVPILFDDRRRGLADFLSHTYVVRGTHPRWGFPEAEAEAETAPI